MVTGVVSVATTTTDWNDTTNYFRLYSVVTGTTSITSYLDFRSILSYTPVTQPYDVVAFYENSPVDGQVLSAIKMTRPVTFSEDFAGSQGFAETQATANTVFSVEKNGTEVGTITFLATTTTPVFATTSSGDLTYTTADILKIVSPTPADAGLSGISLTLKGSR